MKKYIDRKYKNISLAKVSSSNTFYVLRKKERNNQLAMCYNQNYILRELGDSPVGKLLLRQLAHPEFESYSKQMCSPLSFLRKLAVLLPLASVPSNFIFLKLHFTL
jgi:hypothetical protein